MGAYGAAEGRAATRLDHQVSTSEVFNPSISMRTAERVAEEMGIVNDERTTQRQKFWELPPEVLATLEEMTEEEDETEFEEVDLCQTSSRRTGRQTERTRTSREHAPRPHRAVRGLEGAAGR